MVKSRRAGYGFTLIELMITVLLIGVLALMAGPYTINWMHLSDIQRAKGQLVQAHGMAKAAALRNPQAAIGETPVAAIHLESGPSQLTVIGCLGGGDNCSESTLWSELLPSGVELKFDGDVTEIELNNTGGFLGDTSGLGYEISKGDQNETGKLY